MRFKIFTKFSFGLILTLIFINSVFAKPVVSAPISKGIIGVWQLKQTITGKTSKLSKSKFLATMTTPESLILAVEEGINEITINEGFKEFIQTQTLPTDGTIVSKNIQQIGQVNTKAIWQNKKLIVEVLTSRGDKITEIFELSAKQKQLNVTLEMTEKNSAKTVKIRRVYNRVAENSESNLADIGITVYPM